MLLLVRDSGVPGVALASVIIGVYNGKTFNQLRPRHYTEGV
jgi:hypothetical protein